MTKYLRINNINILTTPLHLSQLLINCGSSFKTKNIVFQLDPIFDSYSGFGLFNLIQIKSLLSYLQFNFLSDMTAIHSLSNFYMFGLIVVCRNLNLKSTVIFRYFVRNLGNIFSLSFFHAANWLEREVYDMFGLLFLNNKDLRRILNDYGFKGFPLLKDFPVFGYKEIWYDSEKQQVIFSNVRLAQSWRFYFFGSQWKKSEKNDTIY